MLDRPGPWKCRPAHGGSGYVIVEDAVGNIICRTLSRFAPLIAAAPKMEEILRGLGVSLEDIIVPIPPDSVESRRSGKK